MGKAVYSPRKQLHKELLSGGKMTKDPSNDSKEKFTKVKK